jgi:hypothetical protein
MFDPIAAKISDVGGHREEPLVQPIVHSSTYRIPNVDHYGKILTEAGIYSVFDCAECAMLFSANFPQIGTNYAVRGQ